jgi:hypothetical protein
MRSLPDEAGGVTVAAAAPVESTFDPVAGLINLELCAAEEKSCDPLCLWALLPPLNPNFF